MAKKSKAVGPAKPEKPETFELTLEHAPDVGEALDLQKRIASIDVVDRESHELALEMLKGAKALNKNIEKHWREKSLRPIDTLKKQMLESMRKDLEPTEVVINLLESKILKFVNNERARVEKETREAREREERDAAERRRRELQEAEDKAEALEAASENLSARELWFVTKIVELFDASVVIDAAAKKALANVCKQAGYKDPAASVEKLLRSDKIIKAIADKRTAMEIRQAAIAKQNEALEVNEPAKVESNLGYVAGTAVKTYTGAEIFDATKLVAAMAARGELEGLLVNESYLKARAKAMPKTAFETAYPGARQTTKQGIAG